MVKPVNIAIDVGSGYTNAISKEREIIFPSRVCHAPDQWKSHFGATHARVCRFGSPGQEQDFLIGDAVRNIGGEPENTLQDDWALSDGWMALFYSALADLVGTTGVINVVTGLPQAIYETHENALITRLAREHRFSIQGIPHVITVKNVFVVPQATAALFYQLDSDPSIRGDVGCIDIGTYTTDLAVIDVEALALIGARSTGCQLGVKNLLGRLNTFLVEHHNVRLDGSRLAAALQQRVTRIRGADVDLTTIISQIAIQEAKPILEFIQAAWSGGADLDVYLAGGGAEFFIDAIRVVVPHATVMKNPQMAIARGLMIYLHALLDEQSETENS